VYDDLKFEEGFRIDVLVEDKMICELKAANDHNPVFDAQILSSFEIMANKHLGYVDQLQCPFD
jgi:GxxExxY protein